jgi:hypothetical protein
MFTPADRSMLRDMLQDMKASQACIVAMVANQLVTNFCSTCVSLQMVEAHRQTYSGRGNCPLSVRTLPT